ncbi:MAG: hypothetical protein RIM72_15510 [Alphaproteobacteria bacterium]
MTLTRSIVSGRNIALVFTVAVAVRIVCMLVTHSILGVPAFLAEDSAAYLRMATELRHGVSLLGFDGSADYDASVMPLTVFLMAATGSDAAGAMGYILLQSLVDAGSCVLIGLLVSAFLPNRFLMGGMLAAFNPTQIVVAGLVLTDSIFFFFSMAALLLLVSSARETARPGTIAKGFVLGGALGLACLSRSAIVPWLPIAVILFFILETRKTTVIRGAASALAVILVVLLALAPVLHRNYQRYGEFVITAQAGAHLLYWITPLVADFSGAGEFAAVQDTARERLEQRLAGAGKPVAALENDRVMTSVAVDMLKEYGPGRIGIAWLSGAALNLGLPAITISPAFRALPHSSFYETPGDNIADKILTFVLADQNRSYVAAILVAGLLTLLWVIAIPIGLWNLRKENIFAVLVVLTWFGFTLAINGPVASPKYRLPLEGGWILFVVAALPRRRIGKWA